MNIAVTLPKEEDINESTYHGRRCVFWTVSRMPKQLNINDRVYIIEGDLVSYYYYFIGFVQDPRCEKTGRIYGGLTLLLSPTRHVLVKPFEMAPFQGFHYIKEAHE